MNIQAIPAPPFEHFWLTADKHNWNTTKCLTIYHCPSAVAFIGSDIFLIVVSREHKKVKQSASKINEPTKISFRESSNFLQFYVCFHRKKAEPIDEEANH